MCHDSNRKVIPMTCNTLVLGHGKGRIYIFDEWTPVVPHLGCDPLPNDWVKEIWGVVLDKSMKDGDVSIHHTNLWEAYDYSGYRYADDNIKQEARSKASAFNTMKYVLTSGVKLPTAQQLMKEFKK